MSLTDVPVIDQKTMEILSRFNIRSGANFLVLGPSGGGKTFIAVDACKRENCRLVYVNLAVLERTDFQGFPVVNDDKTLVSYATPDFLPFADTADRDERKALMEVAPLVESDPDIKEALDKRLAALDKEKSAQRMASAMQYFAPSAKAHKKLAALLNKQLQGAEEAQPIVFLFDEVDKAMSETMQTLLEFLQFRAVNGRKLNIKACILTGNLPDEHAHSGHLSHAITKRCSTYKLQLDFKQWRMWAFNNNVHDLVIGFLTANSEMLHKGPPDGDPTAYALPSPRTWTDASKKLWDLERDEIYATLGDEQRQHFQKTLVAGCVGETAAVKFVNWFKYYRKLDPTVEALLEKGKHPNNAKLGAQELFICALSACSRVYRSLKPNNDAQIKKYTKNCYKWLATVPVDVQMGAARMAFGGDFDNIQRYRLSEIDEFAAIFKNIKKTMQDHNI